MRATVSEFVVGVATCDVGATSPTTAYAALPVPANNGAAASADVSTYGAIWTITVDMSSPAFADQPIIEASQDNQNWTPAGPVFSARGQRTVEIYASHIRVARDGYSPDAAGAPSSSSSAPRQATSDGIGAYSVTDYGARGAPGATNRAFAPTLSITVA